MPRDYSCIDKLFLFVKTQINLSLTTSLDKLSRPLFGEVIRQIVATEYLYYQLTE